MRIILSFMAFLLTVVTALPVFAVKKNVCSITLNSSEEIELFKTKLSAKDFIFTELTLTQPIKIKSNTSEGSDEQEEGSGEEAPAFNEDWLMESCRQGIKCDILVVSGHFGGIFFGKKGLSLPLESLESASCEKMCDGIIKKPKEAFLFGCNTLADKSTDHRTPEQYMQVLINDGFTREQAQQVAAFRYSAFGNSFSDRMKRTFSQTPRIYGFTSVGPSGKTAAPMLNKYLTATGPDYSKYISSADQSQNITFLESFKQSAVAQVSGNIEGNSAICYLENKSVSSVKKINYMNEVATKGGLLQIVPHAVKFFESLNVEKLNPEEMAALKQIELNTNGQKQVESFIQQKIPGLLIPQMNVLNLAMKLKWLDKNKYNSILNKLALHPLYQQQKMTISQKDEICSLGVHVSGIDIEKVTAENWSNENFIYALNCLQVADKEVFNKMLPIFYKSTSKVFKESVLYFMTRNRLEKDKIAAIVTHEILSKNIEPSVLHKLSQIVINNKYNDLSVAKIVYDRMLQNKDESIESDFFGLYIALTNETPEAIYKTLDYLFLPTLSVEKFSEKISDESVIKSLASSETAKKRVLSYLTPTNNEQIFIKAIHFFTLIKYKLDNEIQNLISVIQSNKSSFLLKLYVLNYLIENPIQSEILKAALVSEFKSQNSFQIKYSMAYILLNFFSLEEVTAFSKTVENTEAKFALVLAQQSSKKFASNENFQQIKNFSELYLKKFSKEQLKDMLSQSTTDGWTSQSLRYMNFVPDIETIKQQRVPVESFKIYAMGALVNTKTLEIMDIHLGNLICESPYFNQDYLEESGNCIDLIKDENSEIYYQVTPYPRLTVYMNIYHFDLKTSKPTLLIDEENLIKVEDKISKVAAAASKKIKSILDGTRATNFTVTKIHADSFVLKIHYEDIVGQVEETVDIEAVINFKDRKYTVESTKAK
jgi:hypothetical protein